MSVSAKAMKTLNFEEMSPPSPLGLDVPIDQIPSSKLKTGLLCEDASDSDLDVPSDRPAGSDLSGCESDAPSDSDMDVPNDRHDGDEMRMACFGVLADPGLFPVAPGSLPVRTFGRALHFQPVPDQDQSCRIEPVHASERTTLFAKVYSGVAEKESPHDSPAPTPRARARPDASPRLPSTPGLATSPRSPPVALEAVRVSEAPSLITQPTEPQRVLGRPMGRRPPPSLGRRPMDHCLSPSPYPTNEPWPVEVPPSPSKAPISSPREVNPLAGTTADILRALPSPCRRRRPQQSWDVAPSTCQGTSLELSFSGEGVLSASGDARSDVPGCCHADAPGALQAEGAAASSFRELPTLSSRELLSADSWIPLSPSRCGRVSQPGFFDAAPQTPALSSPMSPHTAERLEGLPAVALPSATINLSSFSLDSSGVDGIAISRIHTLYDVSLGALQGDTCEATGPNVDPALSGSASLDLVQLDPVRLDLQLLDAADVDDTRSVTEFPDTSNVVNPLSAVTFHLDTPHDSFDGLPALFLDVRAGGSENCGQNGFCMSPEHDVKSSEMTLTHAPDASVVAESAIIGHSVLLTNQKKPEADAAVRTPTSQVSTAANDRSQSSDNDSAETTASVRVGPTPGLFSPGLCSRAPRGIVPLRWETTAGITGALRDIPENWTRAVLLEMLDDFGFEQQFTCLYMPVDVQQRRNFGYAFLTMTSSEPAERAAKLLNGKASWAPPSLDALHASWTSADHGLCTPPSPPTVASGPELARERVRQRFAAECAPLWFRDGEVVDPPQSELPDSPERVPIAFRHPDRTSNRTPDTTPTRATPSRTTPATRTPASGARAHRGERAAAGSGRQRLVAPKRLSWPESQVEKRLSQHQADEGATN